MPWTFCENERVVGKKSATYPKSFSSFALWAHSCSILKYKQFVITKYFQVYINYVNLVVNLLVPTAVLSVMNCLIYRALRQNQDQANQVGKTFQRNGDYHLTIPWDVGSRLKRKRLLFKLKCVAIFTLYPKHVFAVFALPLLWQLMETFGHFDEILSNFFEGIFRICKILNPLCIIFMLLGKLSLL